MYDIEDENRFCSKVETAGEDECWECVAMYLDKDGYGQFYLNMKNIKAHRFSFQLFHKRLIKDKMCIMHSCDNPLCVNPHHLNEGTHLENMTDMHNKGRGVQPKGEKHNSAKLTEKQVLKIRKTYDKKNGITATKLGNEYGVDRKVIHDIINRKIWKHI